jgi:predicted dehydrogenase
MMSINVGLVGCGNISGIYLENSSHYSQFTITACADLDYTKAEAAAARYGIPHVMSVEELIKSPDIDIILNLTVPQAHAEISIQAMENNKHVYSEKPLAISYEDGKRIIKKAKEKNVLVGVAPDTFLGESVQLAGKLIKDGAIGRVVGATAFMMSSGPESWHPNPELFYRVGGGPMFDMGPYYLTALVSLLGPVTRIMGSTRITHSERTITSPKRYGEKIVVQVPTHVTGILDFENEATTTITTSFDVSGSRTPYIEIYGEKGTISLPDPNHFHRPLLLKLRGEEDWKEMKRETTLPDNARGVGLADMAEAIESGTTPRASGEMAFHVLEIMHGIHDSSKRGKQYYMQSTFTKPELLVEKEGETVWGK